MKEIYGFTGTRVGMTVEQKISIRRWLDGYRRRPAVLRHGACQGADEDVVTMLGGLCRIVAHPPADAKLLSTYAMGMSDEHEPPLPYLERNHQIVDRSDLLIAAPKGPEELRSGTWATIRYATKRGRRVLICWPDGRLEHLSFTTDAKL